MTSEVLKLVHPSTMMIAGPTGSGKTRFVLDLLRHKMFEVSQNELNTKDLERPFPDRLVWVYGEWQPLYQWVKHAVPESTKVDFIQNFDFLQNFGKRACHSCHLCLDCELPPYKALEQRVS